MNDRTVLSSEFSRAFARLYQGSSDDGDDALAFYRAIQTTYIPLLQNLDETSRRSLHE